MPKYTDIMSIPGMTFRPRAENDEYLGILKFKINNTEDVQNKIDDVVSLFQGRTTEKFNE